MLKPASLSSIPYFPITACVAASSAIVTGFWWSGKSIDGFVMDGRVWEQWQLWRALTCTLPHVNFLHLAFNLYWFWVFGTVMERAYGHIRFAAIVVLLALASTTAEFSLLNGGVGLSGVGYGLWAMLWVLQRRDARFADTVDSATSRMFAFWFLLCIVLTLTGTMPVANLAHGVGAIMGALLGLAASSRGALKAMSVAGAALVIILGFAGSTVFWPQTNLSGRAQEAIHHAGLEALQRNEGIRAIELLKMSAEMRTAPARAWYNLGVAFERMKKSDEALAAFEQAASMPDADPRMQIVAREFKKNLAGRREN